MALSQWPLQWPADITTATTALTSTGAPAGGSHLLSLGPLGATHGCTGEEPEQEGRRLPAWVWGEREAVPGSAEEDATWNADSVQWEHNRDHCMTATATTLVSSGMQPTNQSTRRNKMKYSCVLHQPKSEVWQRHAQRSENGMQLSLSCRSLRGWRSHHAHHKGIFCRQYSGVWKTMRCSVAPWGLNGMGHLIPSLAVDAEEPMEVHPPQNGMRPSYARHGQNNRRHN